MLSLFLYAYAYLMATPTDVKALVDSAPAYLDLQSARTHLACARATGAVYGVNSDLLLSIAWHESRYESATATSLPGAMSSSRTKSLRSCGVMTPAPVTTALCDAERSSTLAGYIAGSEHVRVWLRAEHGDLVRALGGVAGGYRFLARCHDRPEPPCDTPAVFLERAERIKALRDHARHSVS